MITADEVRSLAKQAVDGGIPHDGLRQFMTQCAMTHPNNEYYSFLFLLSKFLQPDAILECGTELGRSCYAMAMGCPSADVTTIELIGKIPSTWQEFLGQCTNVRIVCGTDTTSWLVNPMNRRRKFQLAHIDSAHDYETTLNEWSLLRPLMDRGSVVCFDDPLTDGVGAVLKEIALPKVLFDGIEAPRLHGDYFYVAVLIP